MKSQWKSAAAVVLGALVNGLAWAGPPGPTLEGRAVLPVDTLAPGPVAGTFLAPGVVNGVTIPFASQPVEGFSAIIDGREPGEYLAMPDNGFGNKANSGDFLLRAYFIKPDFKTARGGSGTVQVRDFIQLSDPAGVIGFPIVNGGTPERLLTGSDIDIESVRRDPDGDLWFGDEFGPFLVHTDANGTLLEAPFALPGVKSPANPFLAEGEVPTQPGSRGFEGMAISPNGKFLYPALEGAKTNDPDQRRRFIYEFSLGKAPGFTGRAWQYHTEQPGHMIADMAALDTHRLVVIERDGGRGLGALFRRVYVVDLRDVDAQGFLVKREAVDLAAIPDPDLVSLPPLHEGDVGLGNPFRVTCESIEAIHVLDGERLLLGCDNNIPNTGRNPNVADDNEFIVVRVPGLKSLP
jgi:hypothetical protein